MALNETHRAQSNPLYDVTSASPLDFVYFQKSLLAFIRYFLSPEMIADNRVTIETALL
jgi:hypothetical protein